ncbi:hypothetical protein H4R18_002886 [Coemansia javaensis]|uniref:Queuosine 5'-phosphate N-glycosylase/hydrolase n=1 Tax=Coemansia javaensis TaxID=2761396 RepID=A0A9W8LJ84_9FUNG|nr:hypothetical protein H4R18_002886 [Coemansia javaensis]
MALISELPDGGYGAALPQAWEAACTGRGVALPPAGANYLECVRESAAALVAGVGQPLVAVDGARAQSYADALDAAKFDRYVRHVSGWAHRLPLSFDNVAQELNLVALVGLLQIGSGFRKELHAATGRGASDTVSFGCMSLHISQTPLDARGLQALALDDVAQHFGIPLLGKERPALGSTTAVTISEPSALRPLAEIILGCLQDTGRRLEQGGYSSLADFVIRTCAEKPTAEHLVRKLVAALPSLRDAADVGGRPVYLFKKAQLIAYDVCQRFGGTDAKFAFPDIGDLTLFADNVVPAMLQHHGLIVPCKEIAAKISAGRELTLAEATAMRAASIVAAQLVVDRARSSSSSGKSEALLAAGEFPVCQATLDSFWWHEGKEPELRAIERLVCKKTAYF